MKFFKYILAVASVMGLISSTVYAAPDHFHHDSGSQDSSHEKELNERDLESLRDFLRTKRTEDLQSKAKNLRISGDVRSEWRNIYEKVDSRSQRGGDAKSCFCLPISHNDFDIEANLYVNYAVEKAWALMQLQFDNSAGVDDIDCCCDELICNGGYCSDLTPSQLSFRRTNRFHGSGQCDDLCLKRAFIGYNVWHDCHSHLTIELGRRKLYDLFESEIQFSSRFDGLALRYSKSLECVADFYVTLGGFVVDERVNHLAWVTEIGFINICDWGLDFKYSFIDWTKRGRGRCGDANPRGFRYRNSQFLLTYHLDPEIICKPVEIFGAFLINHSGKQVKTVADLIDGPDFEASDRRKNLAWYAGILIGEVDKEGDWSLEVQYQWVQEHAIAWDDQNGVGLGNVNGDCCGFDPGLAYKGFLVDFLYAVTDELTLDMTIQAARGKHTGRYHHENGRHRHSYSEYKLEAIYAF